jgi:hypothetical protein
LNDWFVSTTVLLVLSVAEADIGREKYQAIAVSTMTNIHIDTEYTALAAKGCKSLIKYRAIA